MFTFRLYSTFFFPHYNDGKNEGISFLLFNILNINLNIPEDILARLCGKNIHSSCAVRQEEEKN